MSFSIQDMSSYGADLSLKGEFIFSGANHGEELTGIFRYTTGRSEMIIPHQKQDLEWNLVQSCRRYFV
ncbi:hypothetical protein ICC18_06530 [Paenibacillus sp. WST5]|uniref:Uncharacterized protein n=1 Tax=Paenibacillus sedimenti TaxID=2770274 RepID=A0A926KM05_9BACL|nr:hypothetical protein [Paenibacillus sedimenti]